VLPAEINSHRATTVMAITISFAVSAPKRGQQLCHRAVEEFNVARAHVAIQFGVLGARLLFRAGEHFARRIMIAP
jgi:hypothetical protein